MTLWMVRATSLSGSFELGPYEAEDWATAIDFGIAELAEEGTRVTDDFLPENWSLAAWPASTTEAEDKVQRAQAMLDQMSELAAASPHEAAHRQIQALWRAAVEAPLGDEILKGSKTLALTHRHCVFP